MRRLREPRRIGHIADTFAEGAFVAFIICAVISGVCYFGFAIMVEDDQTNAQHNTELLKLLESDGDNAQDMSTATVQKRKLYAQSLLNVAADVKQVKDEGTKLGFEDDQWAQIKDIAKTGKPAQLDTKATAYNAPFSSPFLPIWLFVAWCLVSVGALIRYADDVGTYTTVRMADLMWRRPTTWLVVLLLGPAVWIAMLVSAILLIWTPYPDTPTGEEDGEMSPAPTGVNRRQSRTYSSAPTAARTTYVSLRTDAAKSYQADQLRQLDNDIEYYQGEARSLSSRLKQTQGEINELRANRAQLNELMDAASVTSDIAGQEFDRITQLPGVIATQVVNDKLRLVIRATHEYKDTVYDLGDWRIDIGPGTSHLTAYSLRYELRPNWRQGDYPSYINNDTSFCFGSRQEIIDEHLRKGQYLEAVSVAIATLCGINKGERKHVPEAFYALAN